MILFLTTPGEFTESTMHMETQGALERRGLLFTFLLQRGWKLLRTTGLRDGLKIAKTVNMKPSNSKMFPRQFYIKICILIMTFHVIIKNSLVS